jgi:hypothetical protein
MNARSENTETDPPPLETRCDQCDLEAVKHNNVYKVAGFHPNFADVDRDAELALVDFWQEVSRLHDQGVQR